MGCEGVRGGERGPDPRTRAGCDSCAPEGDAEGGVGTRVYLMNTVQASSVHDSSEASIADSELME